VVVHQPRGLQHRLENDELKLELLRTQIRAGLDAIERGAFIAPHSNIFCQIELLIFRLLRPSILGESSRLREPQ
jgi:hypothetical protein